MGGWFQKYPSLPTINLPPKEGWGVAVPAKPNTNVGGDCDQFVAD
jgi:hypothetical protein